MVLKLAEVDLVGEMLMAGAVQARLLGGLRLWHHFLQPPHLFFPKRGYSDCLDLYYYTPS
jgi:hypothetical protein